LNKKKDDPEILEDFIEDLHLREMSPETIRSYRSNVRRFLEIVPDYEEADEKEIKKYLQVLKNEKDLAYKTLANNFASVSSFYEYLKYEDIVDSNPVLLVRKRYLNKYKDDQNNGSRQVPDEKEMSGYINYIPNVRDKAIVLLFLKTGIRRNELIDIDVDDINWEDYSIQLKSKPKRSNTKVYFDHETANVLKRWLKIREDKEPETDALFVGEHKGRLKKKGVRTAVEKWAQKYGLHDPKSEKLEEKFTPHTLRTVFTTWLIRNGMKREYIKELRGDTRGEAMDIYHQIDHDELRKEYEASMPELGIV